MPAPVKPASPTATSRASRAGTTRNTADIRITCSPVTISTCRKINKSATR